MILLEAVKGAMTFIVEKTDDGGYVIKQESPLTRPKYDRAGINGPYYKYVAGAFATIEEVVDGLIEHKLIVDYRKDDYIRYLKDKEAGVVEL